MVLFLAAPRGGSGTGSVWTEGPPAGPSLVFALRVPPHTFKTKIRDSLLWNIDQRQLFMFYESGLAIGTGVKLNFSTGHGGTHS